MEASGAQLRRSAAIRVGLSVLIAGALTALAIVAQWGPLDVQTDVIGYPTFKDFNVDNYFHAYYLTIGLFPLLSLGLFFGLTRLAPRLGLATPSPRGRLRPDPVPEAERPRLAGERPLAEESEGRRWGVMAGHIGLVGLVLGLETAIVIDSTQGGVAIGLLGWAALAGLAGLALGRLSEATLQARLSMVNALGAVLALAGLLAVSMTTQVQIAINGDVDHYPWLPAWLILPLAAILATVIVSKLRDAEGEARLFQIERRVVLFLAAPLCLALCLQVLPGELGELDYFHGGEQVVGAHLLESGFFPWSQLVLTHGLFQDAIYDFPRTLFGGGVWGHTAGVSMLMAPLYLLSTFLLLVYLVGRNWAFLLFCALILITPLIAPEQFRLILWPLILLLLATDLDRPTRLKSVAIGFLLVLQTMLTPEASPAILAVAAVLVGYEWYWRPAGAPLLDAFPRTFWVGVSGVASVVVTALFLAVNGALGDFIYVSRNLVHGHTLSGGQPPMVAPGTISDLALWVLGLIPVAALLICFAYGAARLRLRQPIYTEDWVMAAAAIFIVVYYTKFLARMDYGHVYQPFVAGLPLFLYIVYRMVAWAEGAFRDRMPGNPLLRLTTHPLSLVLVAVMLVTSWSHYHDRIGQTPSWYRPAVSRPVKFDKIGYTQVFPATAYRDVSRVIDSYLGPDDRLFDFSNTPLLFYWVIDRYPSTRYFHVSLTYSNELQRDLIRRLHKASPKLIVFDNDSDPFISLSNWDGIPNMVRSYEVAHWILDNYKPLLWTHGFTVYARRDQPPASQGKLQLTDPPATKRIPFTVQPCNWGASPNFLSGPGMPSTDARAGAVGARMTKGSNLVKLIGWAGDPATKQPAKEVVITAGGKVIGRLKPSLFRPDLVAFGLPEGYKHAGFQTQVPVPIGKPLHVYAVTADGRYTEIVAQGDKPEKGAVEIDGRTVRLDPGAAQGQINSESRERVTDFHLPPGSDWADYRWLEVDAGSKGFAPDSMTVYDKPSRPSAEREILFQTLADSPRDYVVPVGSCAQWHGFRGKTLYLNTLKPQDITAVRLIR